MASSSLEVSIVIPFHGRLELAHEAITPHLPRSRDVRSHCCR